MMPPERTMSHKRKHGESFDASSASAPYKKSRSFKPGNNNHQSKHRKRPHVSDDIDSRTSTNALKSRIRDLKRLLAHVDNVGDHKMSASNRIERERELEACEHELAEKLQRDREAEYRTKMIGKYHQVRFFDRKKATRILKRLKKELASAEDADKSDLERKVHNAEVDANYPQYYPLIKPYSSLYPKTRKEDGDSDDAGTGDKRSGTDIDGPKGDVNMWRTVEEAMANGTLDALRNSKDSMPAAPQKKEDKKTTVHKPKENKRRGPEPQKSSERRALEVQQEEEDSDGGFFE